MIRQWADYCRVCSLEAPSCEWFSPYTFLSMFLKLSRIFLFASFFCVAVVLTGTFFPFIGGKYYFFRVMVEAATVSLLFWWAFEARTGEFEGQLRRVLRDPMVIAVSAFALMFLLASLFAHDPHSAFWSNFERGEGGFQMIHYYLFFLLLTLLVQRREEWKTAFVVMLIAGACMVLYGVLAYIDLACVQANQLAGEKNIAAGCPDFGFINSFSGIAPSNAPKGLLAMILEGRFQGSLGNPAYVAPYLLFSMFYVAWLWLEGKRTRLRTVLYGLLILFYGAFFVFSQTRGAFLGLVAGVGVGFVYLFITQKSYRVWLLGIALVFSLGGLGARNYCLAAQAIPSATPPPLCRLVDFGLSSQTFQTRFWTWGSALQGWKERPILGWGPENFSSVFDKYFDPRHFVPGQNSETWFDRAHSVLLDYLAETGALGLLSYAALFVVFYSQLLRFFLRHVHHPRERDEWHLVTISPFQYALLFSLPVAYLVQGLALFDVLPIYINLFFFLAFGRSIFKSFIVHHEERRA